MSQTSQEFASAVAQLQWRFVRFSDSVLVTRAGEFCRKHLFNLRGSQLAQLSGLANAAWASTNQFAAIKYCAHQAEKASRGERAEMYALWSDLERELKAVTAETRKTFDLERVDPAIVEQLPLAAVRDFVRHLTAEYTFRSTNGQKG